MVIKLDKVPGKTVGVLDIHGIAALFLILLVVVSGFSAGVPSAFADTGGGGASDPGASSSSSVSSSVSGVVGPGDALSVGDYVYVSRMGLIDNGTRQYSLSVYDRASGVWVWNGLMAEVGEELPDYVQVVYAVSRDGTKVYAACPGHILEVNTESWGCVNYTGSSTDPLVTYPCSVALSPDGRILYVADYDYTSGIEGKSRVTLVDTGTFNVLARIDPTAVNHNYEFNRAGSHFLAAGQDRVYFAVYDNDSITRSSSISDILEYKVDDPTNPKLDGCWGSSSTKIVLLSPDCKTLVEATPRLYQEGGYTGGEGFYAIDLTTGLTIRRVSLGLGGTMSVSSMAFSPVGDRLYVGTYASRGGSADAGVILVYDTANYSLVDTYADVCSQAGPGAGAMSVSVSHDGNTLFYADRSPIGADYVRADDRFMALDLATKVTTQIRSCPFIMEILPDPMNSYPEVLPLTVKDYPYLSEIVIFDPLLMNSPHGMFLAVGDDEERRNVRLKYIDDAFANSSDKEALKDFVKAMWVKYPVKFEKNGRYTNVSFDTPTRTVILTPYEEAMLDRIEKGIGDYMMRSRGYTPSHGTTSNSNGGMLQNPVQGPGNPPTFNGDTHVAITEDSCVKRGFPDADEVADAATVPDTWYENNPDLPWATDWLKEFWTLVHGYCHYFDPFFTFGGWTFGLGGAPDAADGYGETAKAKYHDNHLADAVTQLGYSSHFVEDVGCPLHAGAEYSQARNQWVHHGYENYVRDNWNTGYTFKNIVENNKKRASVSSIHDSTVDLAKYTTTLCGRVYDIVHDNPDTYTTDPELKNLTEETLKETSKYEQGLIDHVMV